VRGGHPQMITTRGRLVGFGKGAAHHHCIRAASERYRLRFQADVFNVFNHPVFGSPDSVLTSGTFGIPVSMANSGLGSQSGVGGGFSPLYSIGGPRNIQLALKLFF